MTWIVLDYPSVSFYNNKITVDELKCNKIIGKIRRANAASATNERQLLTRLEK